MKYWKSAKMGVFLCDFVIFLIFLPLSFILNTAFLLFLKNQPTICFCHP